MIRTKYLADEYQTLINERMPKHDEMDPELYDRTITNPFVRSLIVDLAFIGGFDVDGDIMTLQGILVSFNMLTGIFSYTAGQKRFPSKAFICKYEINGETNELIVLADSKEDIQNIFDDRKLLMTDKLKQLSTLMLPLTTAEHDNVKGSHYLINNVDIENAIEITNPNDCRLLVQEDNETIRTRSWIM